MVPSTNFLRKKIIKIDKYKKRLIVNDAYESFDKNRRLTTKDKALVKVKK